MNRSADTGAPLAGAHIALGISGGIAAYKAPLLIRLLKTAGADVRALATRNALQFTTRWTIETLSENPLECDLFPDNAAAGTHHIDTCDWADLFVIAPSTANLIGKIASGISDDVLTSTLCAFAGPVVIAPAMNTNMYENPVTRRNLDYLRSIGYRVVEPGEGELACGTVGVGRMAEPQEIFEQILEFWKTRPASNAGKEASASSNSLSGKRIVVTAGPCREDIDPVRFISNRSSGKMGYALAEAARDAGADVTLISGPTALRPPDNVAFIAVESTAGMLEACLNRLPGADALWMAAAPADYRPAETKSRKIKKSDSALDLALEPTPDILKEVAAAKAARQLIVGFALETDDLLENAQKKLAAKDLDAIVANSAVESGSGPDSDTNRATVVRRDGTVTELPLLPKTELARRLVELFAELLESKQSAHVSQKN